MDLQENTYIPVETPCELPQEPVVVVETVEPTVLVEEPVEIVPEKPKRKKSKLVFNLIAMILALILFCGATAYAVVYTLNHIWLERYAHLEQAMLEKIQSQPQNPGSNDSQGNLNTQIPQSGPLTPAQVYAKNVQAVVSVHAKYQQGSSYGESVGSGFLISADGYVVTNYHVVEGATSVEIATHDGKTLSAQLKGKDAANDVALLKVEGENLPYTTLGSSDALVVGEMVVAIGNPLGELTSTLTVGYVSAKDRVVNTDGSVINMLQTDVAINSGNSGGPLFNMNGQVVGITTAKYSGSSNSGATIEGLSFAIPVDDIIGILSDLQEFGYVTGAYLGVSVRDVDASVQSYGIPAGASVVDVVKGGPADKAGIKAGDVIVNIGGYDVDSLSTLTRVMRRFEAGQTVSITVYRSGQNQALSITLAEKPVEQDQTGNTGNDQTTEEEESSNNFKDWFGSLFPPFG